MKQVSKVLGLVVILAAITLVVYAILHWFATPPGTFVDWLIGIGAVLWLVVIVTVPWNLHFEAKTVLQEARRSRERDIEVNDKELHYARLVERRSLWLAIGLHLVSALGLYAFSYFEVSIVGYFGAGATLLFTFLRPAIRAYEYISARLARLRHEVSYPREDVLSLQQQVETLSVQLGELQHSYEESSLQQQQQLTTQGTTLTTLQEQLENLKTENEQAHERLAAETHHAVAQLTEDGQFINHILEIIRFIKKV